MSDEEFARKGFLIASDPQEHVERIRALMDIDGSTVVCLQLIGDLDALGSIRRYGDEVLPALRGDGGSEGRRFEREGKPSTP
jgi:coenzyme F420-dependent glucose-6-phosphate dehydrogenase